MSYAIKEAFYSLQGEGAHSGRPAVFLRFAGCNLGYSVCPFCDTDWTGTDGPNGGRYDTAALAALARSLGSSDWCVLTGGEPALQADQTLIDALRSAGFAVAIETNGTVPLRASFDWITLSPKAGSTLMLTRADELKLLYPQFGIEPEQLVDSAPRLYLQPIDGPGYEESLRSAISFCLAHPDWRLSEQAHKRWGVR